MPLSPSILPTQNSEWGFWGTCITNGYDADMCWYAATQFFRDTYQLDAEDTRLLLDSRFGRHLANDLSFMTSSPVSKKAIRKHLQSRYSNKGWRKAYERAIYEATGKRITRPANTASSVIESIAKEHLFIDTLQTRQNDRLDFHELSAWNLKAALEAAYHAGQQSAAL